MTHNKITFSRKYTKLLSNVHGGQLIKIATLIDAILVNVEDLSKHFVDYDTGFGAYKLPKKGNVIMLIFIKDGMFNLFTTLRRYTPDKMKYYKSAIGHDFDVVIEEKT